jgi:hypothetical protein
MDAFRQSYAYDAWSNQTTRMGRFWSAPDSDSQAYDTRGRNTQWEYDTDGRFISRNEASPDGLAYEPLRQSYDASGRLSVTTQATSERARFNQNLILTTHTTRAETYDGDGVGVKQATTTQVNSNQPSTSVTYYLRSSILGGRVIAELDGAGSRQNSHVYAYIDL